MKKIVLLSLLMFNTLFAVNVNNVTLEKDNGGYIDGKKWEFKNNNNNVRLLMYVDPDEQSKGEAFLPHTFKLEEKYSKLGFQIQVILNLNATWIPDAIITSKLKSKQKKIPNREFIIDKESVLVKKWNLQDDEYNVLLFDRKNKLLFSKSGELTEGDIKKVKSLIETATSK